MLKGKISTAGIVVAFMFFEYSKIWTHHIDSQASEMNNHDGLMYLGLVIFFLTVCVKVVLSWDRIRKVSLLRIFLFGGFCIVALLYYLYSDAGLDFFVAGVAGFALQFDSVDAIIEMTAVTAMILLCVQVVGYNLGLFFDIDSSAWTRTGDTGDQVVSRISFGFGNPNFVFAYLLPVLLGAYYLRSSLRKKILVTVGLVLVVYTYFETDTRTQLIVLFFIALNPIIERILRYHKASRIAAMCAYPLLTILSIMIARSYLTSFGKNLNRILSGRIGFWNWYVGNGFTIIGPTQLNKYGHDYWNQYLDNLFLYQLYFGGLIVCILVTVMHFRLIHIAFKSENFKLVVIILNTLVYSISESKFLLGCFIYMPLLFSVFLHPIDDIVKSAVIRRHDGYSDHLEEKK